VIDNLSTNQGDINVNEAYYNSQDKVSNFTYLGTPATGTPGFQPAQVANLVEVAAYVGTNVNYAVALFKDTGVNMRFMTSCSKFTRPSEYALPLLPQENRLGFARAEERAKRSGRHHDHPMLSSLLLPVVGLAIDGGRAYVGQDQALNCGGWGLAGGRPPAGYPPGGTVSTQTTYATDTAQQFLAANFPSGFYGAQLVGSGTVCVDPGSDNTDPCNVGNGGQVQTYRFARCR